jgi:hypothetical protein
VADAAYLPAGSALLAILHVPVPALNVTVQDVEPTVTFTVSPLVTASPWPVVTLAVKTEADSLPGATDAGLSETVVVLASLATVKLSADGEDEPAKFPLAA